VTRSGRRGDYLPMEKKKQALSTGSQKLKKDGRFPDSNRRYVIFI
jgi:hypothetical protein